MLIGIMPKSINNNHHLLMLTIQNGICWYPGIPGSSIPGDGLLNSIEVSMCVDRKNQMNPPFSPDISPFFLDRIQSMGISGS